MRISEEYKKNRTGSLILPVNFQKYNKFEPVIRAYNILEMKDRRKSAFVIEAIKYYDSLPFRCESVAEYKSRCRIAEKIRQRYRLRSCDDLVLLLSLPIDSARLYELRNFTIKEPKKMLLGFKIKDEEASAMHARLCDLDVGSRVMQIVRAVNTYTSDGMDEESDKFRASCLLRDIYYEYQHTEDKENTIRNLVLMMGI